MGSGVSIFANEGAEESGVNASSSTRVFRLGDLPESCISSILMYLDPPEICKLARVNRAFRCASSADLLWESKLPSNYKYLVHRILGQNHENLAKKDIYARLCQPNYFDDGTKESRLEKVGGGMCLSISYRAMKITGIDDRRYWNHIQTEESRFHKVAYLQQIWWVEVVGELEFQFLPGTYSLYFRLQLGKTATRFGRRACNLNQVHGWDIKPVRFKLSTSNGQQAMSECYLYDPGNWVQYHVGDFVIENENSSNPERIKFSMIQIDCTHTKGGLCIDSALICPRERNRLGQGQLVEVSK